MARGAARGARDARTEILARIRASLGDLAGQPEPELTWRYGQPTPMADVRQRFIDQVSDYRARVVEVDPGELAHTIADLLVEAGRAIVVVPTGLDPAWRQAISAAGLTVVDDGPELTPARLDQIDAVVTAARVGVAETGTIVLDHAADQGRRALSLVPDYHLCVVRADQVVSDVAEAVAQLRASIEAGRALTWISGGSATSDIELQRVEGVHGPRTLVVILVG
jgi:L-lactate dehydrogenase complex protein LldG